MALIHWVWPYLWKCPQQTRESERRLLRSFAPHTHTHCVAVRPCTHHWEPHSGHVCVLIRKVNASWKLQSWLFTHYTAQSTHATFHHSCVDSYTASDQVSVDLHTHTYEPGSVFTDCRFSSTMHTHLCVQSLHIHTPIISDVLESARQLLPLAQGNKREIMGRTCVYMCVFVSLSLEWNNRASGMRLPLCLCVCVCVCVCMCVCMNTGDQSLNGSDKLGQCKCF